MHELEAAFRQAVQDGLTTGSITSPLRWAEKYRIFGGEYPGPYRTDRYPWCDEMHNCTAENLIIKKAAQLGVTEAMLNVCLFTLDQRKVRAMYVMPTQQVAHDFSNSVLVPAMEFSPYIKSMFTMNDSVGLKRTHNSTLLIRGAGSRTQLRSVPVGALFLDEVDIMSKAAIAEVRERLSGHDNKMLRAFSTPGIPGEGIDAMFNMGTQEYLHFQCPMCGKLISLVWPDSFVLCGESPADPDLAKSHLICTECKGVLKHEEKAQWLNRDTVQWVPFNKAADKDYRSLHISQLYSPTVTPKNIAEHYFLGQGSEEEYLHFYNDKMGCPKVLAEGKVYEEDLEKLYGSHTKDGPHPRDCTDGFYVAGVDVGTYLHICVVRYDFDPRELDLQTNSMATLAWEGTIPTEDIGQLRELMSDWQIKGIVFDSAPETAMIRQFARSVPGICWLCQYRTGVKGKELAIADDGTFAPLVTVERSTWMSYVMRRFKTGKILLPHDISTDYKTQVKNVTRHYQKRPDGTGSDLVFVGSNDHFYHAQTYAEIALTLSASAYSNRSVKAYLG